MSLIRVPEHTDRDLRAWHDAALSDPLIARATQHLRRIEDAHRTIRDFAARGPCYAGVSWGKDSVVVAHLIRSSGVEIPLIWVRVEPVANPHCAMVRDEFLRRFPGPYREMEESCHLDPNRGWLAKGTLERGFKRAARSFGDAYISGIRAEESGTRKMRMVAHGTSTVRTCAPIGWWFASDVFAYLHAHDLPVHPAYAMSMGGAISRDRIRVASLGGSSERISGVAYGGGKRGDGHGRLEWERRYYGDALRRIRGLAEERSV